VTIVILLSETAARTIYSQTGSAPVESPGTEVMRAMNSLGYVIAPMHPGSRDPVLRTYFAANVPDKQAADAVLTALRGLPGVEAAYTKPADELA